MLVLSRKVGEEIQIGEEIILKVVAVGRDKVKIGVEAPKHITINRQEFNKALKNKLTSPVRENS